MSKLYIGNLSYDTTENDLMDLFASSGNVSSVKIITDMHSGRSKGFGFVEMSSNEEAQTAVEQLNGKEFQGRTLKVDEAREKPRGGGGGGQRPRGGNRY